jgi:hypothetical protein
MNWRDINRRYEAGVWAVPLVLFPSFLLSAAFGQPSCIEPIIEIVYAYTPVSFANVLLNLFGPFARPLALVGAIALIMPLGGLLGIGAPPLFDPKLHFREGLRWVSVTAAAIGFGIYLGSAAATSVSDVAAVLAGYFFHQCCSGHAPGAVLKPESQVVGK